MDTTWVVLHAWCLIHGDAQTPDRWRHHPCFEPAFAAVLRHQELAYPGELLTLEEAQRAARTLEDTPRLTSLDAFMDDVSLRYAIRHLDAELAVMRTWQSWEFSEDGPRWWCWEQLKKEAERRRGFYAAILEARRAVRTGMGHKPAMRTSCDGYEWLEEDGTSESMRTTRIFLLGVRNRLGAGRYDLGILPVPSVLAEHFRQGD